MTTPLAASFISFSFVPRQGCDRANLPLRFRSWRKQIVARRDVSTSSTFFGRPARRQVTARERTSNTGPVDLPYGGSNFASRLDGRVVPCKGYVLASAHSVTVRRLYNVQMSDAARYFDKSIRSRESDRLVVGGLSRPAIRNFS